MNMIGVCYFGSFYPDYSRNRVLIRGLKENGLRVVICDDRSGGIKHYYHLLRKFLTEALSCNVIIVGAVCQHDVPLAWILAKLFKKKLIFDAFISLYDTYVYDRQVISEGSFAARKIYWWDKLACFLADRVLVDTKTHVEFFVNTFKLKKGKVAYVFVGADNDIFSEKFKNKKKSKKFIVEFHGSYQPLQGVEVIIEAAGLVKDKDIEFRIIGEGQTKKFIMDLVKKLNLRNIKFIPWVSIEKLKEYIESSSICLGIFGSTDKANRVIPNKAYETIAMRKPLITMDSVGARELFVNGVNALLIENQPVELARAIVRLKEDSSLYFKIANGGYILYKSKLTPKILGKDLIKIINSLF